MAHDLKIVAPLLQAHLSNPAIPNEVMFTPLEKDVKERLFYTPAADYSFDRRLSFLPSFKNTASYKRRVKTAKLQKCEALLRITLILKKYQKWIRKKKCIVEKWTNDTDSDESESESESESDSDDEEMDDEEAMNLAIFQQFAYGNNSMIEKIKKNQVYNWINKELSENYNESRLLEDYLHLRNEHKDEFEQIHDHLCDALDKQIKPSDNFKDTYIQYQSEKLSKSPFNAEINIEQLLDEMQLYFAGIFDVTFFHQKYRVMKLIGSGIEGKVHKVKLRKLFDSFIIDEQKENTPPDNDDDDDDDDDNDDNEYSDSDTEEDENDDGTIYYAAKTIQYNERTMNNYRVMAKFDILDDFEMYIDKKNDKLILVSEFWDFDVFDYMRDYHKTFNEEQLYSMMSGYIVPLLFKLHLNYYIHGDIKPSNFVMNVSKSKNDTYENEYGLIDFGTMLKMNELTETIRSSLIGSAGYHAPEILFLMYDGPVKIDTKCDIWALGLTCIYLLTGSHPLISDDLNILGERKIKIKIDKCLAKMRKSNKISQDLMDLLQNMLQIEPLKRYNLYRIQHHRWITKEKDVKRRLLFLDIDGVLNDKKSRPKTMKPELLMKLKKIINLTNCEIVLSSSWRRVPELKRKFKKQFKKIARLDINSIYIGDTPCNGRNPTRCHEIKEYFEKNSLEQKDNEYDVDWCVVDDIDLVHENEAFANECAAFLKGRWVRPNIETGLTDDDVCDIIDILNPNQQIAL